MKTLKVVGVALETRTVRVYTVFKVNRRCSRSLGAKATLWKEENEQRSESRKAGAYYPNAREVVSAASFQKVVNKLICTHFASIELHM